MKPDVVAIFCEDIRHEIGNKASYIGVIPGGGLTFKEPGPLTLSKLVIVTLIRWNVKQPPRDTSIQVLSNTGSEMFDFPIPPHDAETLAMDAGTDMVSIVVSTEIAPCVVEHGNRFEVILRSGKRKSLAGSLRFTAVSEEVFKNIPTVGPQTRN